MRWLRSTCLLLTLGTLVFGGCTKTLPPSGLDGLPCIKGMLPPSEDVRSWAKDARAGDLLMNYTCVEDDDDLRVHETVRRANRKQATP